MNVLVRHTGLILCMWLMLAGVCLGSQVYLKDGGIIDSQSVWRRGDKVFVKVNRDIVADFDQNEIDLRRTFPKKGPSSRKLPRKVSATTGTAAAKPTPAPVIPPKTIAPPAAAAALAQKPAVQPAPAVASTAPKPATPPATTPHLPAAIEMQKSDILPTGGFAQEKSGLMFLVPLAILAVCLLIVASQWIIFTRAGQAGWKSLIPFYNMYILMIISGKPGWWMFLLLIPVVNIVFFLLAMLSLAKKFGRSELLGVGITLLPMVFLPVLAFGGAEYEG